jgi:ribose transport system ATP-binding protein
VSPAIQDSDGGAQQRESERMVSDTQSALAPLMDVRSVVKRYGTHEVLHSVSLSVGRGETVAVIGENGAGKSTLAKLMAGVTRPDEGELRFDGRPLSFGSPRDALQAGIGFIPQELAYWPDLSVGENVLVGTWPSKRGVISPRELQKRALELSERFGIPLDLGRPMRALKLGERQLVEILKVLSRDASALILDEPTAALTAAESRNLFSLLGKLAAQGHGIVYISHRMDEVFRFSDRVDVLRNGRLVASAPTRATTPATLIEAMLGQAASGLHASESAARTDETPALSIRNWTMPGEPGLKDVSLDVARGEVLGLFGLRGSGAELVSEGLGGVHKDIRGTLDVAGRRRRVTSPLAARRAAIGYVPAERKRDGLVLTLSVQANLGLLTLKKVSRFGVLRGRLERTAAQRWTSAFNIRLRNLNQPTSELSGGNQQKVMVASRLATDPVVFALQEPTRGVDIGARVELHRFIRGVAAEGVGLLVVTTDVEEAVSLCDRLLVMRDGAIVDELVGARKTQGRAVALAAGEAA